MGETGGKVELPHRVPLHLKKNHLSGSKRGREILLKESRNELSKCRKESQRKASRGGEKGLTPRLEKSFLKECVPLGGSTRTVAPEPPIARILTRSTHTREYKTKCLFPRRSKKLECEERQERHLEGKKKSIIGNPGGKCTIGLQINSKKKKEQTFSDIGRRWSEIATRVRKSNKNW